MYTVPWMTFIFCKASITAKASWIRAMAADSPRSQHPTHPENDEFEDMMAQQNNKQCENA